MQDIHARIAQLEESIASQQKMLDAYRLVAQDKGAPPLFHVVKTPEERKVRVKLDGKTTDLVRAAIASQGEKTFTVVDLDNHLAAQGHVMPRNKISFILAALIRREEISVLSKGAGRTPSTLKTIKLKS